MSLVSRALALLSRGDAASVQRAPVHTSEGVLDTTWQANWWQVMGRVPGQTFGANGVAETAIQCNAQGVAVCPAQHFVVEPNGNNKLEFDSPFIRLLNNPNHYQTRSDLMLNTVRSLLYTGNAYWYLDFDYGDLEPVAYKGVRVPRSVHLLHAESTRGYWAEETRDIFYATNLQTWLRGERSAPDMIPARNISHFKLHTLADPLRGVSPLTAAAASVAANSAILGHQASFYGNMARPSGVLSTDQMLTVEQMRQLREAWEAQSQGLNSGKVPILAGGLKWATMALSSQDSQLVQAFRMTVEDISRVFRVPLPLVNSMEGSTFANSETLINFWLATGLGFLLDHLELVIQKALRMPEHEIIAFDTSVLLRSDMKARLEALQTGVIGGIYSPNEARAREGLPPAKDGDQPRVQQQVVPLSWHSDQAKAAQAAAEAAAAAPPAPAEPPLPDADKAVAMAIAGFQRGLAAQLTRPAA